MTTQYTTVKNKVLSELDSKWVYCTFNGFRRKRCLQCLIAIDIGPLLGGRIHSQLEKEVVPSLDTALRMAGGTPVSPLRNVGFILKIPFENPRLNL